MSDAEQPTTSNTGDYEVRQATHFKFEVYERNGAGLQSRHVVNRHDGTCSCNHQGSGNDRQNVCPHMEAVVQETATTFEFEEMSQWTVSTLVHDARRAVEEIRDMANEARQHVTALEADAATDAPEAARTDLNEPDDGAPEQEVHEMDNPSELAEVKDDLVSWIGDEQMFGDLPDRPNVDFRAVVADGQRGLALDMKPWEADPEYYDDEWVDQDQWEDDRDVIRDWLLDHDAVQWYGDPDYEIVVPENAVPEVTG